LLAYFLSRQAFGRKVMTKSSCPLSHPTAEKENKLATYKTKKRAGMLFFIYGDWGN